MKESRQAAPGENAISIPVQLRGQTIGRLKLKPSDTAKKWTEDELAIAEATAERAALALEGARLLEQAQKRAARESFLSDIATKLSTSFQLDSILRDTVEELGQTLKGSTISFQLVNPSAPLGADNPNGNDKPSNEMPSELGTTR
jgi:GAF domain-containing protein